MSNFSTYGANQVLDGNPIPATLWCQLHTGNPTAAGTANVAADSRRRSFTRQPASGGATENVLALQWFPPTANEDLTHTSYWDASSGGNCWFVAAIPGAPITAISTQATDIPIGELDISLTVWS